MASQKSFYLVGLLMFFIFMVRFILTIMTDTFSLVEVLSWGGMTFMSFVIGYLQPQLAQKDERMELIKQKAMQYSLIATMIYIFLMMVGIQTNLLTLTAEEVLGLLIGFIVITMWFIFIIVAKRN